VRTPIPSPGAASTIRRTVSTPARCPRHAEPLTGGPPPVAVHDDPDVERRSTLFHKVTCQKKSAQRARVAWIKRFHVAQIAFEGISAPAALNR